MAWGCTAHVGFIHQIIFIPARFHLTKLLRVKLGHHFYLFSSGKSKCGFKQLECAVLVLAPSLSKIKAQLVEILKLSNECCHMIVLKVVCCLIVTFVTVLD